MTQEKVIPIVTTGKAWIVPPGKIKPVEKEVRHVVPVQVRQVVTDEVPIACTIQKGRHGDYIRVFEDKFYRIMPVGLQTISLYMHDALAKENPAACPTWRKDECAWKGDVPKLDEIPARKVVDDGWQSAALRAQGMADRWLVYGGGILQEVPPPCLRIRVNPLANVGNEVRAETVGNRMPTQDFVVRFPLNETALVMRLAQEAFDRSYRRPGGRVKQDLKKTRIDRPDLMPKLGHREFAEDIGSALVALAHCGINSRLSAENLDAFADLKAILERGMEPEEMGEALDLLGKVTNGIGESSRLSTTDLIVSIANYILPRRAQCLDDGRTISIGRMTR